MIAIQRSDQQLWLVRPVTFLWRDQTFSSSSIDSTSTIWKNASGNSGKILIWIQRSEQKLLPLRTVTLTWRDQTSSSPSRDSTSTIWKEVLRKFQKKFDSDPTVGSKVMSTSNRYSCLPRPDLLLSKYRFHIHYLEKGIRKLLKNLDPDLTVGSKVIASTNRYCSLTRPDLLLTKYRFHIHYMDKGILKLM